MQPTFENILSDHFTLMPIFFSPLYWIFGTYTMLIVQVIAILFGGLGIYKLIIHQSGNIILGYLSLIHFFLIWGIYSALGFDYHDNVIGTMFVPWFIFFLQKDKYLYSSLFFILILISKENMALWAVFICLGLMIIHIRNKAKFLFLSSLSLASLLYFIIVVKFIIPAFGNEGRNYLHFHYMVLGNNFSEAITNLSTHPIKYFELFFTNHLNDSTGDGIKMETIITFLFSGGLVLLIRPQFMLMLIPVFFQKFFSDDFTKWGLSGQYSIEFAPILTIGLFYFLMKIKPDFSYPLAVIAILSCGTISIVKIEKQLPYWYDGTNLQFYKKKHYQCDFDREKVFEAFKKIPENASVSAESYLIPRLAFRDKIYHFPDIVDAEYIILVPHDKNNYSFTDIVSLEQKTDELIHSGEWFVYFDNGTALILKKKIINS